MAGFIDVPLTVQNAGFLQSQLATTIFTTGNSAAYEFGCESSAALAAEGAAAVAEEIQRL